MVAVVTMTREVKTGLTCRWKWWWVARRGLVESFQENKEESWLSDLLYHEEAAKEEKMTSEEEFGC